MNLRAILRQVLFTQNTLRYVVEWRAIERAWSKIAQAPGVVVDGGAGSGEYVRRLLKDGRVKSVFAVEYDGLNFQRLTENLGSHPAAKLIHGSLLELPVPDGCADVVLCTQVLEHIEDHEQAAAELNRVLKPGGFAVIATPHPPEPFPNPDHVREGYTEADLAALFAPYEWQTVWVDYFLTQRTVDAMMRYGRLPLRGMFMPVRLADRERGLSWEERRSEMPFGILCLYQKRR
jgi:SAM-dependent methyltransferase